MIWIPWQLEPFLICRSLICVRKRKPGSFLTHRAILRINEVIHAWTLITKGRQWVRGLTVAGRAVYWKKEQGSESKRESDLGRQTACADDVLGQDVLPIWTDSSSPRTTPGPQRKPPRWSNDSRPFATDVSQGHGWAWVSAESSGSQPWLHIQIIWGDFQTLDARLLPKPIT